jgi:hypothetical protein
MIKRAYFWIIWLVTSAHVFAAPYDDYEVELSQGEKKHMLYTLVSGSFGTLLMIFLGLGGAVSLYMTRQGKSQKQAPIIGVLMLVTAIFIFFYRVFLKAGVMGYEHVEF